MGFLNKFLIKNKVSVQVKPEKEFYQSNFPFNPSETIISPAYSKALDRALSYIDAYLFSENSMCNYCRCQLKNWEYMTNIVLSLRHVKIFRDPPRDSKDLKLIAHEGWLADISYSLLQMNCPACSNVLENAISRVRWGIRPSHYGRSEGEFLPDTIDNI